MTVRQSETRPGLSCVEACRRLRAASRCSFLLDGTGPFDEAWAAGPLLAVDPEVCDLAGTGASALERLDGLLAARRAAGGTAETGLAVLVAFEALESGRRGSPALPPIAALRVDRSLRFQPDGTVRLTRRAAAEPAQGWPAALESDRPPGDPVGPATREGRAVTSLPRERYLRSVERIREHIARGDIYQANLCQRFCCAYRGDPFETYASLAAGSPAPRSAYVEAPGFALASLSPECFLQATPDGRIETWPIKGTRARGADRASDLRAAAELEASPKDRAELLMIVDLERNDLSRVCRAGTVRVSELARLRTYPKVHHLVAAIHGELRASVPPSEILRATFPGGSITGAPKLRAMEILRELEPVDRHWFTGSLFWFGDDGSLDSSILIRSWIFDGRRAYLGAGGGIVADSDPESEWQESNVKARALARALGFEPEQAG